MHLSLSDSPPGLFSAVRGGRYALRRSLLTERAPRVGLLSERQVVALLDDEGPVLVHLDQQRVPNEVDNDEEGEVLVPGELERFSYRRDIPVRKRVRDWVMLIIMIAKVTVRRE